MLVTRFLNLFGAFLQATQLYPPSSNNVIEACSALESVLQRWFSDRDFLSLTVQRERLYVDEFGIDSHAPLAMTLVDGMLDRLIRKVMIQRGANRPELQFLANLFNMPPQELRDQGGPDFLLSEKGNSKNIAIIELTDFFSEESFGPDSWQAQVKKAGLDVDEVTRFLIGPDKSNIDNTKPGKALPSFSAARLTRQEIVPLMELLLKPDFFSEIISDLAITSEELTPNPSEIIRISRKTQNTLLLHSNESEEKVMDSVRHGIKKFENPIRKSVLSECLGHRRRGFRPWIEKDFDFKPEEWAKALVRETLSEPQEKVRKYFRLTAQDFLKIKPHLAQAASVNGVPASDAVLSSLSNLNRIGINRDRFEGKDAQAQQVVKTCKTILQGREIHQKLLQKRGSLDADVDTGYAAILLVLGQFAENEHRVRQVLKSFFGLIETLIDKGDADCHIHFQKLIDLLSAEETKNKEAISKWVRKDGLQFFARLLPKLRNIESESKRQTLQSLIPLVKFTGKETVQKVLNECYFDAVKTSSSAFASLLGKTQKEFSAVLENHIDKEHEQFSPARFLRALDLYFRIASPKSREPVRACLSSGHNAVRLGTLLILGQSEDKATALPLLRDIAFSEDKTIEPNERLVAIYGLGIQKDTGSFERIRETIEKEGKKNPEIRNAALYVFALLCGKEKREEITQLYKKTTRSGLLGLFGR